LAGLGLGWLGAALLLVVMGLLVLCCAAMLP
jgi:uncharacterized membrane protein